SGKQTFGRLCRDLAADLSATSNAGKFLRPLFGRTVPAQFQCPFCGQPYTLTDEQLPAYSGKTIACTQCKQEFTLGQLCPSAPPASSCPVAWYRFFSPR